MEVIDLTLESDVSDEEEFSIDLTKESAEFIKTEPSSSCASGDDDTLSCADDDTLFSADDDILSCSR